MNWKQLAGLALASVLGLVLREIRSRRRRKLERITCAGTKNLYATLVGSRA